MLKESFLGRNPSHFLRVDPIVKAYIVSESFLWSAWNFTTPIFAIFATHDIKGGTIEIAASAYSVYLVSRVIFELIGGRMTAKYTDRKKIYVTIFGIAAISLAYVGFSTASFPLELFLYYAMVGAGLGLISPAKNSMFAIHLDKNKEATEWSIADATSFIAMALATALGGFIAGVYGFRVLFLLAALVNLLAIPSYLVFIWKKNQA
ncbi:MAG: MFS transporter [Candidatus Levyibacteriota bacterium]